MKSKFTILIVAVVAIVLAAGIYFAFKTGLFKSSADVIGSPTMSLTPTSGTHKVGDTFDVGITLKTDGNAVITAQTYIRYDSSKLEVLDQDAVKAGIQIKPGDISVFSGQPTNKVEDGVISYSAAVNPGSSDEFTGTGLLATIKFKALATATTNVTFIFEKGSTGYSTYASMKASNAVNILTGVVNGSYVIETSTPVMTLSANPTTIASGGSSVLTWTNTDATCTGAPIGWFDSTRTTATVKPTVTTTYILTCGTVIKQAVVTVGTATTPTVTLKAGGKDALTVLVNDDFELKWVITGDNMSASNCVALPANTWFMEHAVLTGTDTMKISAPNTETFKLTCWPSTGTQVANGVSDQVVVTATAATTCTAPTSQTRTQTCPAGQTGSITEKRTKGTAPTCAWKDWAETANTCTEGTTIPVETTTTPIAEATTQTATTGPETPLVAGGLLSVVLGVFYLIKRRLV